MFGSLVNVATSDNWTDAATLQCQGAEVINVTVRNAGVLAQFGRGGAGGAVEWDSTEIHLLPVDRSMPRRPMRPADAVRFRSHKPGTPARVSADVG